MAGPIPPPLSKLCPGSSTAAELCCPVIIRHIRIVSPTGSSLFVWGIKVKPALSGVGVVGRLSQIVTVDIIGCREMAARGSSSTSAMTMGRRLDGTMNMCWPA